MVLQCSYRGSTDEGHLASKREKDRIKDKDLTGGVTGGKGGGGGGGESREGRD